MVKVEGDKGLYSQRDIVVDGKRHTTSQGRLTPIVDAHENALLRNAGIKPNANRRGTRTSSRATPRPRPRPRPKSKGRD